jgi:hypothetical protein
LQTISQVISYEETSFRRDRNVRLKNWISVQHFHEKCHLKFVYSEKATKFCEISTLLLFVWTADKSKVESSQNFVAFSEYTNFKSESVFLFQILGSKLNHVPTVHLNRSPLLLSFGSGKFFGFNGPSKYKWESGGLRYWF